MSTFHDTLFQGAIQNPIPSQLMMNPSELLKGDEGSLVYEEKVDANSPGQIERSIYTGVPYSSSALLSRGHGSLVKTDSKSVTRVPIGSSLAMALLQESSEKKRKDLMNPNPGQLTSPASSFDPSYTSYSSTSPLSILRANIDASFKYGAERSQALANANARHIANSARSLRNDVQQIQLAVQRIRALTGSAGTSLTNANRKKVVKGGKKKKTVKGGKKKKDAKKKKAVKGGKKKKDVKKKKDGKKKKKTKTDKRSTKKRTTAASVRRGRTGRR